MNINQARDEANRVARAKEMVPELRKGGLYDMYTAGNPDVYFVIRKDFENRRNDARYTVNLAAQTCTCPDFQEHKAACKHLYAVEMVLQEVADEEAIAEAEAREQVEFERLDRLERYHYH